ncbi:hypothetical protein [Lacinutrix sp. WUR7]|nr:hypothetical protein [Lacinutrix sp. WUR7]
MAHKVIIKPEAELDIQDAINWYNEQKNALGLNCLMKLYVLLI